MCYSKEVQLATGSTIWIFSILYYFYYFIKFKTVKNKKWFLIFLKYIILAFLLIGGHQIFEFLSLLTNNQIVYKIGLLLSISSMFFFLRSLETLLNRGLKSGLALIFIAVVAIHMFLVEMSFEPYKFYLKHNSAFIWVTVWMLLFIYFNICAIRGYRYLKNNNSKKTILFYLLATLDFSFLISLTYTLWGYFKYSTNVCTESPSIWCTFYVIQVFILPMFLTYLNKAVEFPKKKTKQRIGETFLLFSISLIILIFLIALLPFFDCLSMKFVFP